MSDQVNEESVLRRAEFSSVLARLDEIDFDVFQWPVGPLREQTIAETGVFSSGGGPKGINACRLTFHELVHAVMPKLLKKLLYDKEVEDMVMTSKMVFSWIDTKDGIDRKTLEDWATILESSFDKAFPENESTSFGRLRETFKANVLTPLRTEGNSLWLQCLNPAQPPPILQVSLGSSTFPVSTGPSGVTLPVTYQHSGNPESSYLAVPQH
jgi:hypothetical protein